MIFRLDLGRRERVIVDSDQAIDLTLLGLVNVQKFVFAVILFLFAIGPQCMVLRLSFDFVAEHVAGELVGIRGQLVGSYGAAVQCCYDS